MPLPGAEKTETWKPVSVERLAGGRWSVDFGQNLSGWARLKMRGLAACDVVTVQYGEKRHDDGTVKLDGNDMFFQVPHSVLRMPGGWFQRDRHVATGATAESRDSSRFPVGGPKAPGRPGTPPSPSCRGRSGATAPTGASSKRPTRR